MREELVTNLNLALETEHNLLESMLLSKKHALIAQGQCGMFNGEINALHILCDLMNIERIYPVYEGDIIQFFE